MKKLLMMFLILICSNPALCSIKKDYKQAKEEQKYRFLYEIREEKQKGRLRLIKAKYNHKVRSRYQYRRFRYYRNNKRYYYVGG